MSVLLLATIGGMISFASTSVGAIFSYFSEKLANSSRWSLSIDFALGIMVSASAFTLIGPAALEAKSSIQTFSAIILAALLGMAFILLMKSQIDQLQLFSRLKSSHIVLASVLMLHNFPEGLASGSALAGLGFENAWPILAGISFQNIPEGALMVLCLRALGFSRNHSFFGGIGSGLVELAGGILAGVLLQFIQGILPLLLSFAGGSMIASVLVEIWSSDTPAKQRIWSRSFAIGFFALPLIQFLSL